MSNKTRTLQRVIAAKPSADGDGVKIQRIAGQRLNQLMDPFLLLDEIRSDDSADYIGGFPSHPHRGFETITYIMHGKMRHRDHLGNEGLLQNGGVQWMSAGRGIIHSEMPEQEGGLLHGFQLWLNLPAREKMKPAHYQDFQAEQIPVINVVAKPDGGEIKVVAGDVELSENYFVERRVLANGNDVNDQAIVKTKVVQGPLVNKSTQPAYLDIHLNPGVSIELKVAVEHTALLYIYEGATDQLLAQQMGVYVQGDRIKINAADAGVKALLLTGHPLKEPVVQYGPFVMNTMEEINQAIDDYNQGRLTA